MLFLPQMTTTLILTLLHLSDDGWEPVEGYAQAILGPISRCEAVSTIMSFEEPPIKVVLSDEQDISGTLAMLEITIGRTFLEQSVRESRGEEYITPKSLGRISRNRGRELSIELEVKGNGPERQ